MADPVVRLVDRTFVLWVFVGLLVPFLLGWLIGGTLDGGADRPAVGRRRAHARRCTTSTYSINSLCHFFGAQAFDTGDESRNLAWLSFFTFGEAWHNNHHAFPTSARHGMKRWQFDPSALGDLRTREDGSGVGRRAHQPRAPGRKAVRRSRGRAATTEPLRRELAAALPERPFTVDVLGRDGAAGRPTAAAPRSTCARPRRSATCCARPASSASAAPT